jgi:CCR4-NOT transcriptional complex subunit CAF120
MQIESLPTRSDNEAPLQNVLSISTAGKNRYLLHFNSHHSLIQWTAGIRLAMFEHTGLQEAYTGALIAGKGKALNNINVIMERARLPIADWARVRFGAGTPWRRCWCVITPPDEKEVQKLQKQLNKKKSAYDRTRPPVLKGDVKFYDSKKTKKVRPIATISDAYSAFAIYPQSKPLIDASTLVKVEGSITIHSNPPTTTEGFVFVMPEVHPAVTGFEMMLRWLFPVFDTFGLYGRPGRLIPDTTDIRSLMFAMPKHRRYGYLEILDVSGLLLETGSTSWKESEWRKRMKELTGKRMTAIENGSQSNSRYSSRRSTRNSFGPSRSRIQFDDGASVRSTPSIAWSSAPAGDKSGNIPRTDSALAATGAFAPLAKGIPLAHRRSVSETQSLDRYQNQTPVSNYDGAYDEAPIPPPHAMGMAVSGREPSNLRLMREMPPTPERVSSDDERAARSTPVRELQDLQAPTVPEPVAAPPAFAHPPGAKPISKPYHSPELRRANSRMSNATLSQLAVAGGVAVAFNAAGEPRTSEDQRRGDVGRYSEEFGQRGVFSNANKNELPANEEGLNEGLVTASNRRFSYEQPSAQSANTQMNTNYSQQPQQFPFDSSRPGTQESTEAFPSLESSGGPPFLGHSSNPSADSTISSSSQPYHLQTSQSINRKPLPGRSSNIQTPTSAETISSTGSLGHHIIDQAAFDMIGRDERDIDPIPASDVHRQNSGLSSLYDDGASTASPDYASTRRSIDEREPVEKPRAGVMRTVGKPELDNNGRVRDHAGNSMDINFGPTFNYAADRLPLRAQSPGPLQSYGRTASPGPGNYPTDRATRQTSPSKRPGSSGKSKSPNRKMITPENLHYRANSPENRTVAWQPGMAVGTNMTGTQGITPEQFVQQRAAVATSTPLYTHQRQQSSNTLGLQGFGRNTPTPPLVRNRSNELLVQGHSRNNSADLLQRPGSRGASVILGPSGSGDIASGLSAREQEHIAKMTGQPLIKMAQNSRPQVAPAGLVGAIEVREKEKAQMKKGINSQAVEHAIAQRQQHAIYQQQSDQMAVDYRNPQLQYGSAAQYPQQYPIRGSSQPWVSPAASNVYAQGGGWSGQSPSYIVPSPGYAVPSPGYALPSPGFTVSSPGYAVPDQGHQSPSQYPSRQQYFPPQQQGGQGRGNQGYQGQGF